MKQFHFDSELLIKDFWEWRKKHAALFARDLEPIGSIPAGNTALHIVGKWLCRTARSNRHVPPVVLEMQNALYQCGIACEELIGQPRPGDMVMVCGRWVVYLGSPISKMISFHDPDRDRFWRVVPEKAWVKITGVKPRGIRVLS